MYHTCAHLFYGMDVLPMSNLLQKYNLRPKKGLGQNFLTDSNHLRKIIAAAELTPADTVLEIGPGLGALTAPLAETARAVVAVEVDADMVRVLHAEISAPNFRLVQADILAVSPAAVLAAQLPYFSPGDDYVVVANVPYYITSGIIRHLLESEHPPRRTVLTIQKEVAQRITAGPGKMSVLAVSVQFYGAPTLRHIIPADAFSPPPKVDSAVLRIDRHPSPPVPVDDPRRFFRVVKAGFSQKRKQLKNSLSAGLHRPQSEIVPLLESVGIDPRRRAETLSLAEWASLTKTLIAHG